MRVNPFQQNMVRVDRPASFTPPAQNMFSLESADKASFKDVVANMVKETDRSLSMPDELMNRALTQGDVDIHEVMIANTKADIAINLASQIATKVLQAYERVQQIQI